ncbi:hypothetical protein M3Y96_01025900 [Aphelenchoides besseyi]|nr:hypothetical protein M3Y96_01025900 [Aphelenchoides besseyi]
MELHTVFQVNCLCASFFGFALNLLLLFLISYKTPSAMRSYARIMRIHVITDLLYDFAILFTGVHPVPIGGKVYLITQGFYTHTDISVTRYICTWYFWEILIAIALLPIDFFYRFKSVCHNTELQSRTIYIQVFFAYFITWLHAFPNSFNYLEIGPRTETAEFTSELQRFELFNTTDGVPSYGVTVLGGTKALSNFIFILLLNAFAYTVITYTSIRIFYALKHNANKIQNSKAAELQRQVTRILALQASVPLLIICVPTIGIVFLALAHIDVPRAGAIYVSILSWLSAVKPAATIAVVPRYRNYVKTKLFGNNASVHPIKGLTTISDLSVINQSENHNVH